MRRRRSARSWRRRAAVRRITGEPADLAESRGGRRAAAGQRHTVAAAGPRHSQEAEDRRHPRRRGRASPGPPGSCGQRPVPSVEATRQIAAQTRQRLVSRPRRRHPTGVSLHDPDARPIAKGRLGKPVELGHKAQTVEHDDCVVAHHNVEQATPPTHPIGARGQAVSKRAGRPPRTVTADRGYGEKSIVDDLHDLGVRDVVVPHKGQPSAANNIGRRSDEPFHGAPGA